MPRYETRLWSPDPNTPGGRRNRQPFRYDAFIPDEIGELDPRISATTAALIGEADAAIRELNDQLPPVTGIEALARQLLRQEAIASSRIEGFQMGHRRLAKEALAYELAAPVDSGAAMIVGNIRAMESAIELGAIARELRRSDIIEIHRTLLSATRDAHLAGWVRDRQNWIGGNSYNPRDAQFIPPPADRVEPLLDDLTRFLNRTDLPASLQAAIAHAQFETIHPFADGNGRVGRALIHVVFRRAALAERYVPPISVVLATESGDYIRGLTHFRSDEPERWYIYFATKTLEAAHRGRVFGAEVEQLEQRWRRQAGNPRRGSAALELIGLLVGQPVINVKLAAGKLGVNEESARRAVVRLEETGILKQLTVGKRNRAWEARDVFGLLDDFEQSLPRVATRS